MYGGVVRLLDLMGSEGSDGEGKAGRYVSI